MLWSAALCYLLTVPSDAGGGLHYAQGQVLLGSHTSGIKSDGCGRLLVKLQDGSSRLPDVFVTDKTDTFHMDAHTYSSFRLMARAFQRDLYGNAVLLDHIAPAVSEKFIVSARWLQLQARRLTVTGADWQPLRAHANSASRRLCCPGCGRSRHSVR